MPRILAMLFAAALLPGVHAAELPIFDAHVHYSHDAVEMLPTEEVVTLLRKAKVKRALVSSSDDDGTQKLYKAAPDLIVPSSGPIGGAARSPPGCAIPAW
ncbi:MAG: hypothetical protein HC807_03230 [Gammaproteobacteria bacterium]|nr:hypothetical protein [Gammaproteobacteria bacterium]